MSLSIPSPDDDALELSLQESLRSRAFLIQRLSDVVCWPVTRIPVYERELAADILVGLLRVAGVDQRRKCAQRLAVIMEAPKLLLRYLARDEIDVARPLLEHSKALDDSDLVATIRGGVKPHWLFIAQRRSVSELVCDALLGTSELDVIRTVLKNEGARLSHQGVQLLVSLSRRAPDIAALLAARAETSPAHALTMFWWSDAATRLQILRRFPVDRGVLCSELGDLFALNTREGWADPETRKAIALLERRQRNRRAAERNSSGSLEAAITALGRNADASQLAEISHMGGIRPATGARIFADRGGEALAVFCKATGLKRDYLAALWKATRRSTDDGDRPDGSLARTETVFDLLATAKAQTVLRYWNWSFTSSMAPGTAAALDPDDDGLMEFSPAQRSASLVFGLRDTH